MREFLIIFLAAALMVSCGDDEPEETDTGNNGGSNNGTVDMTDPGPTWTKSTVDPDDVGLHVRLVSSGGTTGIAYYGATGEETGDCDELGDMPPPKIEWEIFYAEESGGSWNIESVVKQPWVGAPPGLDLAAPAGGGGPAIAAMTGTPSMMFNYCGVNDMGLFTRDAPGSWSVDTAVSESGEAASGHPPSDFGGVVGYWPALAFDLDGNPAVAYRDVHGGGLQSDDFRSADLEFAYRQGGWAAEPVDFGKGTGQFNEMIFDHQDRAVIATYNPFEAMQDPEPGVWIYRSDDAGANWERVRLYNQPTTDGPALTVDPETGNLRAVYYHSGKGYPEVARLESDTEFESVGSGWSLEDIGDSRYDEGYEPSIGVSPSGRLSVAYYRCTKATSGLGDCNAADDALIFAWEDAGEWTREVVDEGTDGFCGRSASLAFDSDGAALIAYRCEELVDGELQATVKFARRKPVP